MELIDDATGGQDEPKRPVMPRRRGLGKGLGAILPSPGRAEERRSRSDEITDLPNRAVLDERFEQAMARCSEDGASLAVLVVALDDFAAVNESFGHRVGDELLQSAAARLLAARRKSDTVARFAGDEFVVVCPYVASAELACQMAVRILEDLSRPTSVEGVDHELSASIGVVFTSPRDTTGGAPTLETLLGDASLAMRHVKEEGGASWKLFDPAMRRALAVRSRSRHDLRAAMEEGRLVLEYEPIVDLGTGAAVGDCALLAWRQPAPELDESGSLLDLVDQAGLAVPIGTWMLDQALTDLGARTDRARLPADFRVWVKVTPSFLADPALVAVVDELSVKHRVAPSVLGLDIREPAPAALVPTEAALHELDERDVVVALDDFGAGRSNLALLQRLPIAGLKLAPALVSALGGGPTDLGESGPALVHGLIELGRALELTVVAQGVETEAEMAALRALGCGYAQGPFLGHAAAAVRDPGDEAGPNDGGDGEDRDPGDDRDDRGDGDDDARGSYGEGRAEPESESLWAPGTMSTEP